MIIINSEYNKSSEEETRLKIIKDLINHYNSIRKNLNGTFDISEQLSPDEMEIDIKFEPLNPTSIIDNNVSKIKIFDRLCCCKQMNEEGWYVEFDNGKILLNEDYSCHYMENVHYCPWCNTELVKANRIYIDS